MKWLFNVRVVNVISNPHRKNMCKGSTKHLEFQEFPLTKLKHAVTMRIFFI